ncbi:MAG TPA: glutathione S-transferase C-terminal domain-containing protein, partial [Myxococcota bacterium]
WAHRTRIVRALLKLDDVISMSIVSPLMLDEGWVFDAAHGGDAADLVTGKTKLHEIYTLADPHFTGKVTVPVLWDKQENTIVNNESAEILRLLDRTWNDERFYPAALRAEIDEVNDRVYPTLNNGVYRCGFAQSQAAYDEAIAPLFLTMDWLDTRLTDRRFLVGDDVTEADIRLFTTLVRFDAVYVTHFKCNKKRLVDYPALLRFTRRMYQLPGVKETIDFDAIKAHYFKSHAQVNPSGIVPVGFDVDFDVAVD